MADFFLGTALTNSAAPTIGASALEQKMGRDHHLSLGVQQEIAAVHRARGELRRQHRPLPERHDEHQHSRAGVRAGFRRAGHIRTSAAISYFDDTLETTYHALQT